jgi:adenylylsulfate kinase-like enzyme
MILWITGLSGSGKTTLASEVTRTLRERHLPVLLLDGDELREIFGTSANNSQSYTRQDRLTLALRYSALCRLLAEQHIHVVIATISLFREVHEWNRNNLKNYFQVYLKVPLEELARRDPKKIYSRYHAGDLKNVAGLDLAIDEPHDADWMPAFEPSISTAERANELLDLLQEKQLL